MKPKIFIASAKKNIPIAECVSAILSDSVECNIWRDKTEPSTTILDTLIERADKVDFGLFIFGFDDIIIRDDKQYIVPRDNVIFEAGLFIGKIGLKQCFILKPKTNKNYHILSDLEGITLIEYEIDENKIDDDNRNALVAPCFEIKTAIMTRKILKKEEMKIDQVAALCYRKKETQIEICLVKTDNQRWIIPKNSVLINEKLIYTARAIVDNYEMKISDSSLTPKMLGQFRHRKTGAMHDTIIGVYPFEIISSNGDLFMGEELDTLKWLQPSEIENYISIGRTLEYRDEIINIIKELEKMLKL